MSSNIAVKSIDEISPDLPLFRGIPEEKIGAVLRCLNARILSYPRGETIARAEERLRSSGYLIRGEALSVRYDCWGNRSIIGEYPIGSVIAGNVLFSGKETTPLSIIAAIDCQVLEFNIDQKVRGCPHCMKYANIVKTNATHAIIESNTRLTQRLDMLSNRSTKEKLLSYLSKRAEAEGSDTFLIPYTRQELADYLYIERSSLSRELSNMQKDGLITVSGRCFTLLHP